ncbi:MAG: hypothetical protein Q8P41_12030 [Pseudomonadota bacterium]|nr:hypothetical protein [Pseudomonadota bacterium]
MHRFAFVLVLPVALSACATETPELTYAGGDGITVTFAPVEGAAVAGEAHFEPLGADWVGEGCGVAQAGLTVQEEVDVVAIGTCTGSLGGSAPDVTLTEELAGPFPFAELGLVLEGGEVSSATFRFDDSDLTRLQAEVDLVGADVDLDSEDALAGQVGLVVAWEHVGGRPDFVRTEWIQPVTVAWSFDPATRRVHPPVVPETVSPHVAD